MLHRAAILGFVGAAMLLGCGQKAPEQAATVEEKTYTVTPASVSVKIGIVSGEISEMKVTERVEQGSGTVVTPPKLLGTLKLRNTSTDQAVRLAEAGLRYVDVTGKPIELAEGRTKPSINLGSYSSSDRLDPAQELTQSIEVEFPAAALEKGKLKEIGLDLVYLPLPYKRETASFVVSVSGP